MGVAAVLTVVMPGVLLYWLLLHTWVGFWRRLGAVRAMTILWSVVGLVAAAVGWMTARGRWLSMDWGFQPGLWACGLGLLAVSVVLRRRLSLHFSLRGMSGLPELAPQRHPQKLVSEGLYSRMRHPRYVQLLVALTGWALLANHPAAYVATAVWVPGLWIIARLEERELRERFGPEYEAYCQRVPRWGGRIWKAGRQEGQGG